MKKHEEHVSQEVNSRNSPNLTSNKDALFLGSQTPPSNYDFLIKVEDLIADENLAPPIKLKKIKALVEKYILDENNPQVICDIANDIAALKANHWNSIRNYFFKSEDNYQPITELLLDRYMVLLIKDIEARIQRKNIDLTSDEGIVFFNGSLGLKIESDCSKELQTLMQLAGKTERDFYHTYRRELSYEIIQRWEDIQREVYDYEKNMEGALMDFSVTGHTF